MSDAKGQTCPECGCGVMVDTPIVIEERGMILSVRQVQWVVMCDWCGHVAGEDEKRRGPVDPAPDQARLEVFA